MQADVLNHVIIADLLFE